MLDKKRINLKGINTLTKDETDTLLENLKKMDQFEFLVNLQTSIK